MHFFVYLFFLYVHFLNTFFCLFLALADIGRQGVWGYILAFQAAGHNKIAEKPPDEHVAPVTAKEGRKIPLFFRFF